MVLHHSESLPGELQNALPTAQRAIRQNPTVGDVDDKAAGNSVEEKDPKIVRVVLKIRNQNEPPKNDSKTTVAEC